MSFDYNKTKSKHESDGFWTSYSDLFLGLSTIFLLLYVTASLRAGTNGVHQQIENQKLSLQVEDLKNQLKMYDSMREEHLKQSSDADNQNYEELMDKLSLLQEKANDEKHRLLKEANENGKKERALNQYQQMVRNMINSNVMGKTKVANRDQIIGDQDQEISGLESDVKSKKRQIAENEAKINQAADQLKQEQARLKKALISKKLTKVAYEKQLANVKRNSEAQVQSLKANEAVYEQQLQATNNKIKNLSGELNHKKAELGQVSQKLGQTTEQLQEVASTLGETKSVLGKTQSELGQTKNALGQTKSALDQTQSELGQTKNALGQTQSELGQTKNALGQTASALGQTKAELGQTKNALGQTINALGQTQSELGQTKNALGQTVSALGQTKAELGQTKNALGQTKNALGQTQAELGQTKNALGQTKAEIGAVKSELQKAKAERDLRKDIAAQVKKALDQAGVKAEVNGTTGEVTLDFGDAYFESDSAKLKEKMKSILEKAMPAYARSLFGNPKIAGKITDVEIVGFASPTYQGRYVDPESVASQDKQALKYNMDLSYRRAKSIFNYIVDEKTMEFDHQRDMYPVMKVSGRSFLEVIKVKREVATSSQDFCKVNDCKKAQRVLIRFGVDPNK